MRIVRELHIRKRDREKRKRKGVDQEKEEEGEMKRPVEGKGDMEGKILVISDPYSPRHMSKSVMHFSVSSLILTILIISVLVVESLAQTDGDLRLVNGTTSSEGRVEMYYDTKWMAISNKTVGGKISLVVCRQLGLPAMRSQAVVNAFGRDVKPRMVLIPNAQCDGNEDRLIDCNGFDGSQQRLEDAHTDNYIGVICKPGDGDLRLVNGDGTTNEGRVEIYHNNTWNTMSTGHLSKSLINFPTVVCRQLRLPFTEAQIVADVNVFGAGTGRVLMVDISCKPGDNKLMDCEMYSMEVGTETSLHHQDVGITCKGEYISSGEVRLVNGSDDHRGRLEMYLSGSWSSFCSRGFTTHEARVACRQLGLDTSDPVVLFDTYLDSNSKDRSYFASCTGFERRIIHCPEPYRSFRNCLLSGTWEDNYCGASPAVGICCSSATVSCGSSIGCVSYTILEIVLTITGICTCIFLCGCCLCWRRNKRKKKYGKISQNRPTHETEESPQNPMTMAPVQGVDVPVNVHSPGSSTYPPQPYPYPWGQVPQSADQPFHVTRHQELKI